MTASFPQLPSASPGRQRLPWNQRRRLPPATASQVQRDLTMVKTDDVVRPPSCILLFSYPRHHSSTPSCCPIQLVSPPSFHSPLDTVNRLDTRRLSLFLVWSFSVLLVCLLLVSCLLAPVVFCPTDAFAAAALRLASLRTPFFGLGSTLAADTKCRYPHSKRCLDSGAPSRHHRLDSAFAPCLDPSGGLLVRFARRLIRRGSLLLGSLGRVL
jgi:hypothetical protein